MPESILEAVTVHPFTHPDDEARQREEKELGAAIEELSEALERENPDPVDVLEDELARELGLRRHPGMSPDEWRRARIGFIDPATPPDVNDDL